MKLGLGGEHCLLRVLLLLFFVRRKNQSPARRRGGKTSLEGKGRGPINHEPHAHDHRDRRSANYFPRKKWKKEAGIFCVEWACFFLVPVGRDSPKIVHISSLKINVEKEGYYRYSIGNKWGNVRLSCEKRRIFPTVRIWNLCACLLQTPSLTTISQKKTVGEKKRGGEPVRSRERKEAIFFVKSWSRGARLENWQCNWSHSDIF